MKKLLFIIFIHFICSVHIYAQQEHPKATSAKAGEVLYLYNRNMRGFLVGGNNFNTQASLSPDHAYKVVLEKCTDDSGKWDGITYFITDSVEFGDFRGGYRKLFVENNGLLYVDQNEQGNTRYRDNLWTIEEIEEQKNVYKIAPSPLNKKHNYNGKQLGVMALSAQNLPVVGLYNPIADNRNYEWCFVTGEEKEIYLERMSAKRKEERKRLFLGNLDTKNIPDEQVVYMFNTDYEGFLIGGNNYNTQASLSRTDAHKVILHKYIEQGNVWDGKSYVITDSVQSGSYAGKYRNMFIDSDGIIWVDQNEQSSHLDYIWNIEPSKGNPSVYLITPSEKNRSFKSSNLPNYYLGAIAHTDYRELPSLSLVKGVDSKYCTWMFITEEQWKQLESYNRREELQKYIDIVRNGYPNVDLTKALNVCINPNCSPSEIENQIGQMRLCLFSNGNVNSNSVNFTSLIKNADFEQGGGIGWNRPFDVTVGSITWYGGASINHCAEAYQAIFEFNQEIKGIPNGLYRVDLNAFYRTRGADLAWIERDSSFVVSEVFANNIAMPIRNLMHTTFPTDSGGYDFLQAEMAEEEHNWAEPSYMCMDGTFVPYNMRSAALSFAKGYYDQSLYCLVSEGIVKLGIRQRHKKTGAWTAWDNFRLTYLPEKAENYREAVRCHLEKAKETERLAGIKRIDSRALSETIKYAEHMVRDGSIETLRGCLTAINDADEQVRGALAASEFGEEEKNQILLYSHIVAETETEEEKKMREERNVKQGSTRNVLDEANSYLYMGMLVKEQDAGLALRHLQHAFDLFADIPSSYTDNKIHDCVGVMYMIYKEKNQYDNIIELMTKYSESRSGSGLDIDKEIEAMNYNEMGVIYNDVKKEYQKAEMACRKAADIIGKLYESYRNSDNKEASTRYQQILAYYLNNVAQFQGNQGNYEEAVTMINRVIDMQPDDARYYDCKGMLLYKKGDRKGAMTMWNKIVGLDAEYAKNNSMLSKLLSGK